MEVEGLPRTVPFFGGLARVEVMDTKKRKSKKGKSKKGKAGGDLPTVSTLEAREDETDEQSREESNAPLGPASLQVKFLAYSKEKKKFIVDDLSKRTSLLLPLALVNAGRGENERKTRLLHAQFACNMSCGSQALYLVFLDQSDVQGDGDTMEVDAGELPARPRREGMCSVVAVDPQCRTLAVVAKFSMETAGMEHLEDWKSGNDLCSGPSGLALLAGPCLLVWNTREVVHVQWDEELPLSNPGQLKVRRAGLQSGSRALLHGSLDPTSTDSHFVVTLESEILAGGDTGADIDANAAFDDQCLAAELIQSLAPAGEEVGGDADAVAHARAVTQWSRAVAGRRRFYSVSLSYQFPPLDATVLGEASERFSLSLFSWYEIAGSFANVAQCLSSFWSGHDQLFLLGTSFRQLICFKDADVLWALALPHIPARLSVAGISSGNQGIVVQYDDDARTVEIYSAQSRKLLKEFVGIEEVFIEDFSSSGADQVLLKPSDPSKGFQFTNMASDAEHNVEEQMNVSVVVDLLYARYLSALLSLESSEDALNYKLGLLERSLELLSSYSDGQTPLYKELPSNEKGVAGEELILLDSLAQEQSCDDDFPEEQPMSNEEVRKRERWPVRLLEFSKIERNGCMTLFLRLLNSSLREDAHCNSIALLMCGGIFGERTGAREGDVATTSPPPFVIPAGKSLTVCVSVKAELSPLVRDSAFAAMGEVAMVACDTQSVAARQTVQLQCWGMLRLKQHIPTFDDRCIEVLAQCSEFPVKADLLFLSNHGNLLGFAQILEDVLRMQQIGSRDTRILFASASPLLHVSLHQGRQEVACGISAAAEHDVYVLLSALADHLPKDVRVLIDPSGPKAAEAAARASMALLEEQRRLGRWLDGSICHKPAPGSDKAVVMKSLLRAWSLRNAFVKARLAADRALLELSPWLYCPECDHWKDAAPL